MTPTASTAGRYALDDEVGRGAVGIVYRARDLLTARTVAVKVLAVHGVDAGEDARMLREGRLLALLQHPHIVQVFDVGRLDSGAPYVAMEWLDGEDLAARLQRGVLPVDEALTLAAQVADALANAHAAGVVHRDIKPSNVFCVRTEEGAPHIKLVDFGVAAEQSSTLTRTGAIVGTPAYMAPEQARGDAAVDSRADLYALGATLFEMLVRRPPHVGPTPVAVLARLVTTPAPRLGELAQGVPLALDELLASLLAADPAERPKSAEWLAEHLRELRRTLSSPGPLALLARDVRASVPPASVGTSGGPSTPRAGSYIPASRLITTILATHVPKGSARHRLLAHIRSRGAEATELGGDALVAHLGVTKAQGDEAQLALEIGLRLGKLGARVGVATGRTRVDGPRPIGETVDRAAALARDAATGELLIDATTAQMSRGRFEIELRADRSARVQGATTEAGDARDAAPMSGRDAELAQLRAAYEHCVDDRLPTVASVTGAPGLGKTRLRRELLRQLRDEPSQPQIVLARCESFARGHALGVVVQIARNWLGVRKDDSLVAVCERITSLLGGGARVPNEAIAEVARLALHGHSAGRLEETGRVRQGAGEPAERAMHEQSLRDAVWLVLTELLRGAAQRQPLVLAIEDAQWIDDLSLEWLEHALLRSTGTALFVLLTMRPNFWRERPGACAGREHARLELRPLSQRHLRRIAVALLGERKGRDEALLERIASQASGSPLFAEELARLAAQGHAGSAPTIEAAIQVQLDALEEDALSCAVKMSVFGESAWLDGLRALGVQRAEESLRALSTAGIVVQQGQSRFVGQQEWSFKHALTRDVAYAGLADEVLAELHARAGEWLSSCGAEDAVVARHFELGRSFRKAGMHLERAARHALSAHALVGGVQLAERALAFAEEPLDAFARALLLDEGWSRLDARASERSSAIQAMRESVYDAQSELRMRSAAARYDHARGGSSDTNAELEAVRQKARSMRLADEEARAGAVLAERLAYAGELERAEQVASELLDIAERWGNFSAAADAWQTLAVVRQTRGQVAHALSARRSAAMAARSGRLVTREATLRINVGFALTTVGAAAEALESLLAGMALAQDVGSAGVTRHGQMNLLGWSASVGAGASALALGEFAEVLARHPELDVQALLEEPRRVADDAAGGGWVPSDRGTLGTLYYRGLELLLSPERTEAAATLLKLAEAGYRATGMLDVLPVTLAYRAEALRRLGRVHEAAELISEARSVLRTDAPSLLNEAPVYLVAHDVAMDLGDLRLAREVVVEGMPRLARRVDGLADTSYASSFLTGLPSNAQLLAAAEAYGVVPDSLLPWFEGSGAHSVRRR